MEGSQSPSSESNISKEKPELQASKKRKVGEKTVVAVKVEENEGKHRNEGPPSDCWSWRKYGQKPIKGSPYPRGYYRCSTSKGCSAKKQVERCRTDASMFIITYTSTHNHLDPNLGKETKQPKTQITDEKPTATDEIPTNPKPEQIEEQKPIATNNDEDATAKIDFNYSQSPFQTSQDIIISQTEENPFTENLENTYDSPQTHVFFNEEPLFCPNLMTFSTPKSEENDFYDELEELPMSSSSFKSFMRTNFFEERILVQPS